MNKPASRVEAILQRMLGADTNIEKPASRVEFLLSNVKDLLLAVEDEVEKLEGKTTRLLYSDKTNPTAQEIDAFAIEKGYESPYEGVAVVVSGTYHIWHFYENDNIGWRDDGVDTIAPFTNSVHGSILGSADDGKIGANQDGTGSVNGLPVIKSVGRSSVKTITENVEGDVDRTNTAKGSFSVAFGSRIFIGSLASESAAFGGLIKVYGQDGLTFGYRVISRANQSLSGGYRCTNNASESVQLGSQLAINGTITYDEDGNPKSDSRYNVQFGHNSTMEIGARNCFMSGEGHSQGEWCKWLKVIGKGHIIGNHNECVNVIGYANETTDYLTDSTIEGYDNTAYGGTANSKRYDVYIRGHENMNRDANGSAHSNVYLSGKGLRPMEDDQVIVGAWNSGVDHCWFEVGCGTNANNRNTAFAVCQQGNNKWIKVGSASLTESDVADMATKTFVNSIVGDINSVLDTINGTVI